MAEQSHTYSQRNKKESDPELIEVLSIHASISSPLLDESNSTHSDAATAFEASPRLDGRAGRELCLICSLKGEVKKKHNSIGWSGSGLRAANFTNRPELARSKGNSITLDNIFVGR